MPFVIQDPPETVYVYTLVEYPLGNYFLGLHSGHDIHMSEFASAVQNMLKVPSDLPGATGRCFSMQFKTKQDLEHSGTGRGSVILLLLQLWGNESEAQDMSTVPVLSIL